MKYLIILNLIFISSTFANSKLGKPMMYEKMLDNTQKNKPAKHLCHNFETKDQTTKNNKNDSVLKINTDYFNAKIKCSYHCKGSSDKTTILQEEFRPLNLSLFEGDGSSSEKILWRSLGVTLKVWGQEKCYNYVKKLCPNKIEKVTVSNISSGNWSWNTELNCSQKDIVYSPFDDRFQLANNGISTYKPFSSNPFTPTLSPDTPTNELKEFIINETEKELYASIDNKDCKNNIKIHSCFGDCVWESQAKDSIWSETLSTTEHLGTSDFTICADNFLSKIKNKNYSKNIRKLKCEKYVWEVMRKTELMGSSCAALRIESNCENI